MRKCLQVTMLLICVNLSVCWAQEALQVEADSITNLQGDYLGQTPPDLKPVLFAPEIVSTNLLEERDMTFTPDLKELYFTRDERIMVMKRTEHGWTAPVPASFSSGHSEAEPHVVPVGNRLYFVSQRPLEQDAGNGFFQIWFVDRTDGDWSEPQVFADRRDYYPTLTSAGIMYFTDANNDLFRTRVVGEAI
ncbi:MAG: hypothetical protein JSV52_03430, partial [Candidatus Zixiibacteriota bacterium]